VANYIRQHFNHGRLGLLGFAFIAGGRRRNLNDVGLYGSPGRARGRCRRLPFSKGYRGGMTLIYFLRLQFLGTTWREFFGLGVDEKTSRRARRRTLP
jgi:hypothetical protein